MGRGLQHGGHRRCKNVTELREVVLGQLNWCYDPGDYCSKGETPRTGARVGPRVAERILGCECRTNLGPGWRRGGGEKYRQKKKKKPDLIGNDNNAGGCLTAKPLAYVYHRHL